MKFLGPLHTFPVVIFIFAASVVSAPAGEVEATRVIGAHYPILTVAKNVNPKNLMVVYTKVDAAGRFLKNAADRNRPVLDFYWLMDGKNYKPVNGLIKNEIGKRLACHLGPTGNETHFSVNVNDLKEVDSDIREPKMDVCFQQSGDTRKVQAQMSLGPSDGNIRIKLSSIYTEGSAFPPAVYSVTLHGEQIVDGKLTGKKITRRYEARTRSK